MNLKFGSRKIYHSPTLLPNKVCDPSRNGRFTDLSRPQQPDNGKLFKETCYFCYKIPTFQHKKYFYENSTLKIEFS